MRAQSRAVEAQRVTVLGADLRAAGKTWDRAAMPINSICPLPDTDHWEDLHDMGFIQPFVSAAPADRVSSLLDELGLKSKRICVGISVCWVWCKYEVFSKVQNNVGLMNMICKIVFVSVYFIALCGLMQIYVGNHLQ